MKRSDKKLFAILDELVRLTDAIRMAEEELVYHKHLNEDAQRDAAVSESPLDRADARQTARDVARTEGHIVQLKARWQALEFKRTKLQRDQWK